MHHCVQSPLKSGSGVGSEQRRLYFRTSSPRSAPGSPARCSLCLEIESASFHRHRASEMGVCPSGLPFRLVFDATAKPPLLDGGHHTTPTGFRIHSRPLWALDPHASTLVLSQYIDGGPAASSAPFARVRCTGTVVFPLIHPHAREEAPRHARSRGKTYMRPSSLASCMRRMLFLAAITAGAFDNPPPQRKLPATPSLGLARLPCPPCLQLWLGPSDSDLAWSRPCRSWMIWGKGWRSPWPRLVDRCCKAHGCPRPWDRLVYCNCSWWVTSLQMQCYTNPLALRAYPSGFSHICSKSNVQMVLVFHPLRSQEVINSTA